MQVVDQAFKKFETSRNIASYRALKDAFDSKKHPEVANGRKSADEILNDFLEIFEMHHNTFNGFKKTDQVSKEEFMELYRTLSPSYDDDSTFTALVRGVWGIKNDVMSSTYAQGWAGGNDTAINSRDRYIKANSNKGTPFGTSLQDNAQIWNSTSINNFRPVSAQQVQSTRIAGAPSRQQIYVQQQYSAKSSTLGSDEEILEKFRDKMRQRGARGILNLKRVFKIIDDSNDGQIDYAEFMKAVMVG